jgi:hypothetical protein
MKTISQTPTPILLLTNMVLPGKVDPTLANEIKTEVQIHGEVLNLFVFEVFIHDLRHNIQFRTNN